MRVLVVATQPQFSLGTRLMAALAAGLAARGDVVAMATAVHSETEKAIERLWPRLSVRAVTGSGWFRQAVSLRGIVTALRPDALLVGSEHDAVLGAFAVGKGGAVVRRLTASERPGAAGQHDTSHEPLPWRARFALARARVVVWGDEALALGWPAIDADASTVVRLPVPAVAPVIAIMPGETHDTATASALRALAHLRTRHPALQVLLLGEPSALQSTRLHAAALGLAEQTRTQPIDALLRHELRHLTSLWVAATGDSGALVTLAAMQQGVPPVVMHNAPFASLVVPGSSGYVVPADGHGFVVSELARLLGDDVVRTHMGRAAAHKAEREHGWERFVDEAATLLARTAGVGAARITRRPSLTPA